MQERIYCLDPLFDFKSTTLILGTIPGVESLRSDTYYANNSNHFWDFMYRILIPSYPPYQPFDFNTTKNDRYDLLLSNTIALWDVISDCLRIGSNDRKIRDEKINDIAGFLKRTSIKRIFCNGEKPLELLKKNDQLRKISIPVIKLNSTSSLNPNNTFLIFQDWQMNLGKMN